MIRKAYVNDESIINLLAKKLWPECDVVEILDMYVRAENGELFIAFSDEKPIGFAICKLRNDYVEGTNSSPVGYLEGIYVDKDYRKQGIASSLVSFCEEWAKEQSCSEFASDCEINNTDSLNFHLKLGFNEVNRLICFAKKI